MKTLIVLSGPTGIGKTETGLQIAEYFDAPIVSSDSRQMYRELKIGTAAPSEKELARVTHYFIGTHSIHDFYNAGQYELDVIKLLEKDLFHKHNVVLLVGGSMMYIDAVCNGIDNIPTVDEETRRYWKQIYAEHGLEFIQKKLKELDPKHYEKVDKNNYKRILHALEICDISGKAYSDLLTGEKKERSFTILKIALNCPREELYERIDKRVDKMLDEGLLEEAKRYYPYKELNTLNTVGYKELYEYFDGKISLEEAVRLIKRNSRHYAKKQLSWFRRDKEIHWFRSQENEEIINFIQTKLEESK